MDIMTKYEDVKARLLDIQEERQRKIGEKAAKEAAVEVSALCDIVSFVLQVFQGYYYLDST